MNWWRDFNKNGDLQAVLMMAATTAGNTVLVIVVALIWAYFSG